MIKAIQKIKNKKGFTLVELIVVIAIIAILTAVIVPLVSRYSAQAQYTTLQNNASTISSSANTAIADANQKSAVTVDYMYGEKKSDGTLSITYVVKDAKDSTKNVSDTITSVNSSSYSDVANKRATEKLWESLNSALPSGCTFYIEIKTAAVEGVIYSTTSGTVAANVATVSEVTGFENAYSSGGNAIGVSGIYMKKDAPGPSLGLT